MTEGGGAAKSVTEKRSAMPHVAITERIFSDPFDFEVRQHSEIYKHSYLHIRAATYQGVSIPARTRFITTRIRICRCAGGAAGRCARRV